MSELNITVAGGTTTKLLTAGKYCDKNILITAEGGGGGADIPEEAFNISGDCNYHFSGTGWTWFIDAYGNQLTTSAITNGGRMFSQNTSVEKIPFDINFHSSVTAETTGMFQGCSNLKEIGNINDLGWKDSSYMFQGCNNLHSLPVFNNMRTDYLETSSWVDLSSLFSSCGSLRTIPSDVLSKLEQRKITSAYSSIYSSGFYYCYSLDELRDLPICCKDSGITSNIFRNSFYGDTRLKALTFRTENGTPIAVSWKNQNIDLTREFGYATPGSANQITGLNSGITEDKRVTDAASYAALKNDPDWYTTDVAYSRYNHDSAVETINSLPDTSAAGGVNTIQFLGAAGSATDGGAINTLTEEEIAVATAKGWTVSFS